MRPTFYGLEIARTGLFMSQNQMDVTGHNISNADTVGFTRQRIVQEAIDPYGIMTRLKDPNNAKVGAGVLTQSLDQIRDVYLDRRIRNQNADTGYWTEMYDAMYQVESLFLGELGESKTSLLRLTSNFFSSVDALADPKNASDREIRINLFNSGNQLATAINDMYVKLEELQYEHEYKITEPSGGIVARINQIADEIVEYDRQIFAFEMTGDNALDLRDQRNLLIDELSTLVDIEYYEDTNNKLHISISGTELVNHRDVQHLTTKKILDNPINGKTNDLSIVCWENGSQPIIRGGILKANLDARDGVEADALLEVNSRIGIPQIVEQMNDFVQALAREFNALHSSGFSYPNEENAFTSKDGFDFFHIPPGGTWEDVNISNFRVSDDIDPDRGGSVWNIAVSDTEIVPQRDAVTGELMYDPKTGDLLVEGANNEIALKLQALLYQDIPRVGSLRGFIESFLVTLGSTVSNAETRQKEFSTISYELSQMFQSFSGVSTDEEMTNLIRFNHAYRAASRCITTIDEQLDTLINRTGRVGL